MDRERPERPWLLHVILFTIAWAPFTELLRIIFTGEPFAWTRLLVNVGIGLGLGYAFFSFWAKRMPPDGEDDGNGDAS